MTLRRLALVTGAILVLHVPQAPAEPILKPHKYEGPIPQNSFSLRVGMFGGADNQEMIQYLDEGVQQPFEVFYEDFGTGLAIDLGFIHKPHPRFGVRVNASASFFSYTSTGDFVPQVDADSLLPQLEYDRELKVDLFVLEGSGVYYFSDASTKEFQTYLGAGYSIGFPHQVLTESRVDVDTGEPYTDEIPGRPQEASEWDVAPGVHAVGGLLYYLTERWAINAEARVQYMQSQFDQLQANDPETGEFENVSFVIDYAGFYLSLGATYGF
jgi:hypothetical protein